MSIISYITSFVSFEAPVYRYCHGTTFSALYLMSRLQGDDRNCLVPFGNLEYMRIPTFSGECFRGISDSGINRTKTSWSDLQNVNTAVDYSRNFAFSFENTVEYLQELTDYSENHITQKDTNCCFEHPPYGYNHHTAYWNKTLLRIRQIRAWDEPFFQDNFKEKLSRWLDAELEYFNTHRAGRAPEEEEQTFFEQLKKIRKEIESPVHFQLSPEDKVQVMKTYPIVLLNSNDRADETVKTFFGAEYGMNRLKLGQEICGIATLPEHMDEVKGFIYQQGLARRVEVISMYALPFEKLFSQMTPRVNK